MSQKSSVPQAVSFVSQVLKRDIRPQFLTPWSRRVVGYAISRSIDGRVAVAALKAAIRVRQPPRAASTTRIAVHNTPPSPIATCWPTMVSSAPWAGVAIPMTTPRPKAS